jgi:hypothetical protein
MAGQDLTSEIFNFGTCQKLSPSQPGSMPDASSPVLPLSLGDGILLPEIVLSGQAAYAAG